MAAFFAPAAGVIALRQKTHQRRPAYGGQSRSCKRARDLTLLLNLTDYLWRPALMTRNKKMPAMNGDNTNAMHAQRIAFWLYLSAMIPIGVTRAQWITK